MTTAYCGAKKHQGTGTCHQPAGWGTPHPGIGRCKLHGGCTPDHRQNAAEQQARQQLARLNLPPVDNPLAALAAIAAEAVAWKDAMADRVNALTAPGGGDSDGPGLRYESSQGGEQLRSEVALWERALDRCEKFLVSMARLDIDERLARISEAQAAIVLQAFGVGFDAIRADPDERRAGLRAIEGFLAA